VRVYVCVFIHLLTSFIYINIYVIVIDRNDLFRYLPMYSMSQYWDFVWINYYYYYYYYYVGLLWAVPKSDVNIMTYSLNNLTLHLSINSLKPITDEHVLMATEVFVWKVLFARLYRQFSEFYFDLYTCSKVSLPTWQYTSCERKVGKVHVDDAVFVCM
jgi:hypothetical protein